MRLYTILIFLLIGFEIGFTQSVSDSIFMQINRAKSPTSRLKSIVSLTDYYQSIKIDSLDKYAYEAVKLAKNQNDSLLIAKSGLLLAQDYLRWGWLDSCMHTAQNAQKYSNINSKRLRPVYFELQRLIALSYGSQNNFTDALPILYDLVEKAESHKEYLIAGLNSNSIGSLAFSRGEMDEALLWMRKGLSYTSKTTDPLLPASCYTNLAMTFSSLQKNDSAEYYINKAIPLSKKSGNIHVISTALRIYSSILLEKGKTQAAENALQEMLTYRKEIGNENQFIDDKLMLADFYIQSHQVEKAIELCNKALKQGDIYASATEGGSTYINDITVRLSFYEKLAECYKIQGNKDAYGDMLEQIIAAKDSLYKKNTAESLAELQTMYDVQQKEKTILKQRVDLAQRSLIALASIAGLLIAATIFILLTRRNKRRHRLRVAEAEEKERKRIAADLHDNIGVQANVMLHTSEMLKENPEKTKELIFRINDTAKDMLFVLRETLWALKSSQSDLNQVWLRVLNFLGQMSTSYHHIQFLNQGEIPDNQTISSSRALNLLMIIQESVNNAVKHSKADTILVKSFIENENWILIVIDNGKGFELNEIAAKKESYGLENMKQRASESDFEMNMESEKGKGTTVKISLSLN